MAHLQLEQLRKVYPDGHVAVAGASFEVAEGELLALVGPSGCGKTTLLRMVAGLEEISDGTLRIGGRVVNGIAPGKRDIAMVFQNYALYPHMTVAENLGFSLRLRGLRADAIAARVGEAARMLELDSLLSRRPAQLSGGQRQRVALGRALVRQPQAFLLDEPLSNLDARLRAGMRVEIAQLHRRLGATMLYVTHDQVEAMTLGERIVVMKDGEIQQIDTPMALYRNPANLFVASFLGSPAMNVLPGALLHEHRWWWRLADGTRLPLPAGSVDAGLAGRELLLGLRPEQLQRAGEGEGVEARVEVVEPVGSEVHVHLRLGAQPLVARLPPEQTLPVRGEPLWLRIAPGPLHLFDPATGTALTDR